GGIRFDRQSSSLKAASVPAVAGFEALLPAVSAAARDEVYAWTNITPRAAIAYAVGRTYHVTARGGYAMFASQLAGTQAAFASPSTGRTVRSAARCRSWDRSTCRCSR